MNPKPIPKVILILLLLTLALALSPVITRSRADMGDPGGNLTLEQESLVPVSGYAESAGFSLKLTAWPSAP